ncbi:hypothetical protein [Methylomonas sp. AM2-LC]|uniref:hypothetical protein n=1 Tax=Methylomonas sp. AM2-LC TaxID=3153301 RepID=UPI0032643EAD
MSTVTCQKVVDPITGAVSYTELPAAPSSLQGVLTAIQNAGPQASSYAGVGLSTAIAGAATYLPPGSTDLASNAAGAVLSGLAGNLPGAVLGGIAVASGLLAIIRNEKSGSLSNAQIQQVVSSLTQQQLISLLEQSAANGNAGSASAAITASPVKPASTVQPASA